MIKLFITYKKIRDRIAKGVEITYELIYYSSPTYTIEASKTLKSLNYPIRNHKARDGQIFYQVLTKSIVMANVIKLSWPLWSRNL